MIFFFNSWGASPPDPPLPLFKSLQKSLCFVEHENQLGDEKKTYREKIRGFSLKSQLPDTLNKKYF